MMVGKDPIGVKCAGACALRAAMIVGKKHPKRYPMPKYLNASVTTSTIVIKEDTPILTIVVPVDHIQFIEIGFFAKCLAIFVTSSFFSQ